MIYANGEVVNYGTTWVPTAVATTGAPYQRTSAILCTTAGTLVADFMGTNATSLGGATAGATNVSIAMLAGQVLPLALLRIHTGSSGAYVAFYGDG